MRIITDYNIPNADMIETLARITADMMTRLDDAQEREKFEKWNRERRDNHAKEAQAAV
ncbi:MAG: hypothetical protein PUE26_07970 [Ruminococcus sp.]|nr:hypothetical protein [Ruminococcus sp.]MDD6710068.1 hypothetical protein [Ruminococcus sp.]